MDKFTPNTNNGAADAPGTPPGAVLPLDSAQEPVVPPERSGGAPGASQDSGTSAPDPATPPVKRGPGKPKGLPKSGGRAKGTPNKSTAQTRDRIQELADPIAFLADVMAGRRMVAAGEAGDAKKTWVYPTLAQRVQAGETLLRKLLPDLKATELTGKDGAPLVNPTHREELLSTMEAARFILASVREGEEAAKELAEMDAPAPDLRRESQWLPGAEPKPEPEPVVAAEAPAEPTEPTEPPLPKHAYIFIEQGERERSGERAWLVKEGPAHILRTFHGVEARRQARDWMASKFGASPEAEVEVPLPDEVPQPEYEEISCQHK